MSVTRSAIIQQIPSGSIYCVHFRNLYLVRKNQPGNWSTSRAREWLGRSCMAVAAEAAPLTKET
jgi:hypothetical protein